MQPDETPVCLQDRNTIVLPSTPADHHHLQVSKTRLSILRVFSFESRTMRSGVVAQSDQGPPGTALLFLKGAPDVIRHMVQPASVPPDFQQVIDTMHVMTQSQCLQKDHV